MRGSLSGNGGGEKRPGDSGILDAMGMADEKLITAPDYRPGVIRHIVLFRYRDDISEEELAEVRRRFLDLAGSLRDGRPYITSIEWGPQSSPEGLHGNFRDAFIVTFESEGDRNYYVGEPVTSSPELRDEAHHSFKAFVGPYLAAGGTPVLVFDFMVQDWIETDSPSL
jgi:hypothetical protein